MVCSPDSQLTIKTSRGPNEMVKRFEDLRGSCTCLCTPLPGSARNRSWVQFPEHFSFTVLCCRILSSRDRLRDFLSATRARNEGNVIYSQITRVTVTNCCKKRDLRRHDKGNAWISAWKVRGASIV